MVSIPSLAALPLPPKTNAQSFPSPAQLLPARPFTLSFWGSSNLPFSWRGERVAETPDAWELEGGAIQMEEGLLLADHITYRPRTGDLLAQGRIRLEGRDLRLRCERFSMNWISREGEAHALELEIPPDWTLKADRVRFQTTRKWFFEQVMVTQCPQDSPGWEVWLSSLRLDLDSFAHLKNPRIWVGKVPVFYLPYALYPAKANRSSGLLPPTFGASSAFGPSLGISYYQTLGESADATLSPEILSKEGVLWGGELRWNTTPTHYGEFVGQGIRQKSNHLYRYRYSLREVYQREDGWQVNASINQASDNLVDADFGHGAPNIGAFQFDSSVYLGRSFSYGSLSLNVSEQRNFFRPDDKTYYFGSYFPNSLRRQSLPQIEARLYPVPLGDNFYFDTNLRFNRFRYLIDQLKEGGELSSTWNRIDLAPRIHGRLAQIGFIRADLELLARATAYSATLQTNAFDPYADPDNPPPTPDNVKYPLFQVEGEPDRHVLGSAYLRFTGPRLGRKFEKLNFLGYKGDLKHVLEPYLGFIATGAVGRVGYIPRFDTLDARPGAGDSAAGERSIEFGMRMHLLGRPSRGTQFNDLVRYKVGTRYHYRPVILSDGRILKGWASVDSEVDVEPNDTLRLSFRRSNNFVDDGADNAITTDYRPNEKSRLSLAYFSTGVNRFLARQKGILLGGSQSVWDDRIRYEFQINYDHPTGKISFAQVNLAWVEPCVAYILKFSHLGLGISPVSREENRIEFVLTLKGIGDVFRNRQ